MSIIEHQPGERPSEDSPGCEEYYVIQCDQCGECWEVGAKAEELEFNRHVCADCEKKAGKEAKITGSSRSDVTTRPSAVRSNDLLAVIQDLVREIDAVLSSKGIRTRLCDTNIAWHARRVREALEDDK